MAVAEEQEECFLCGHGEDWTVLCSSCLETVKSVVGSGALEDAEEDW